MVGLLRPPGQPSSSASLSSGCTLTAVPHKGLRSMPWGQEMSLSPRLDRLCSSWVRIQYTHLVLACGRAVPGVSGAVQQVTHRLQPTLTGSMPRPVAAPRLIQVSMVSREPKLVPWSPLEQLAARAGGSPEVDRPACRQLHPLPGEPGDSARCQRYRTEGCGALDETDGWGPRVWTWVCLKARDHSDEKNG